MFLENWGHINLEASLWGYFLSRSIGKRWTLVEIIENNSGSQVDRRVTRNVREIIGLTK